MKQENKEKRVHRIFHENPYDIETFFEGLQLASKHNKELQYVDRFITHLRLDPTQEVTTITFNILRDFGIVKYNSY
jgi:transcription initiation factor TFIIIB Brf1 subunit/transcription initiation factor TFIIB